MRFSRPILIARTRPRLAVSLVPQFVTAPGWSSDPTFRQFVENACLTQNMSAVPPTYRPLPPDYDINLMSTISLSYNNGHTRVFQFLPWAMVDGGNLTRVGAGPQNSTEFLDPDGSIVQSVDIRMQLEFYNSILEGRILIQ